MEKMKSFNVCVVYTDGRASNTLHYKAESREEVFLRMVENAKNWNETILSITVTEDVRKSDIF